MKTQLDMDKIAKGLRAERSGKVTSAGGYFGALQLMAEINARLRVPSGGGRRTDPRWTQRRLVPLAPRAALPGSGCGTGRAGTACAPAVSGVSRGSRASRASGVSGDCAGCAGDPLATGAADDAGAFAIAIAACAAVVHAQLPEASPKIADRSTRGRGRIEHALAVLVPENPRGDPEQSHVAVAVTDALISGFGRVRRLRVTSLTSVLHYMPPAPRKPIRQIAQELDVDRVVEGLKADSVTINNMDAAYHATSHLIKLGHQDVAFIGGPETVSTARLRKAGYLEAMKDAGNLRHRIELSNFLREGGYQAMQMLLDSPNRPSALLVANNVMMLGALQCIHEHQLAIPKDIALVAFDDTPWVTSLQPPLTVIAQPTFEMGKIAARLLLDRIERPDNPIQRINLETQLVIRQSCGYPLGGKSSIRIDTPVRFH